MEQPEKISDLTVIQKGAAFELTFTRPLLATDGERLTKPLEIEIFRAVAKIGAGPAPLDAGSAPWQILSSDDLQKFTEGEKVVYPVNLSSQEFIQALGSTFVFSVRGLTRGFRGRRLEGPQSDIVRPVLLDVSPPVENVKIKTTEKALDLGWTPPSRSLSGRPLAPPSSYQVYWSPTGKPGTFQMRGETALPSYSDSEFAFDQTYFYKVRAIFKQEGQVAESGDSAPVAITPLDVFPPAPPSNVSALSSAGAVQLVWTSNTEPDLAGYNVYRRENDGVPQRLNSELLRTPTFEDRTIQAGHHYFYRVTSVDLKHNESSPSEEVTTETQ